MNGLKSSGVAFDESNGLDEGWTKLYIDSVSALTTRPFTLTLSTHRAAYNKNLIPIRITYSPPATICYFSDGDKIVVKCAADEKYIKEVGVQACIMKKLFGSRQKFLKLVHAGYDQPTKKSSEEITKEHIQKIIARINQIPDEE